MDRRQLRHHGPNDFRLGPAGHAMLLDCRSLETQPVPLPAGVAVVVLDTSTRRGLVDSAYNERRAQCEAAAEVLRRQGARDVTPEVFQRREAGNWTRPPAAVPGTSSPKTTARSARWRPWRRGDMAALGS